MVSFIFKNTNLHTDQVRLVMGVRDKNIYVTKSAQSVRIHGYVELLECCAFRTDL